LFPVAAVALTGRTLLFHCSVRLGELSTGVADADPSRPNWPAIRDHYAAMIDAVPQSQLIAPDYGDGLRNP